MSADSNLRFSSIPTLDKLPTNYIRCLYQDKKGYMWIGTPNGLFMYDGYKAIPVRMADEENFLPNNEILCIAEDNNHYLWVGTRMGLAVIDKTTWNISCVDYKEFNNTGIQQILVTTKGNFG